MVSCEAVHCTRLSPYRERPFFGPFRHVFWKWSAFCKGQKFIDILCILWPNSFILRFCGACNEKEWQILFRSPLQLLFFSVSPLCHSAIPLVEFARKHGDVMEMFVVFFGTGKPAWVDVEQCISKTYYHQCAVTSICCLFAWDHIGTLLACIWCACKCYNSAKYLNFHQNRAILGSTNCHE